MLEIHRFQSERSRLLDPLCGRHIAKKCAQAGNDHFANLLVDVRHRLRGRCNGFEIVSAGLEEPLMKAFFKTRLALNLRLAFGGFTAFGFDLAGFGKNRLRLHKRLGSRRTQDRSRHEKREVG